MKIFVHMPYVFNAFFMDVCVHLHFTLDSFVVVEDKITASEARKTKKNVTYFLLLGNCATGKISFPFLRLISPFHSFLLCCAGEEVEKYFPEAWLPDCLPSTSQKLSFMFKKISLLNPTEKK